MYRPTAGIGDAAASVIANATQQINKELAIDFDAGNTRTRELGRFQPISDILFYLTGGITIGTAAATALKSGGAMNLIQDLILNLDSDFQVLKVPGRYLKILSHVYDMHKRTSTDPGLTVGSHPIAHGFRFPCDVGGYYSNLDASGLNSLTAEVKWGQATDVLTPAGTTTLAVNAGTKLKIQTVTTAGYGVGQRGGVGFPYLRHMWQALNKPANQAGEDRFILNKKRVYSGLVLFANDSDGVPTDDVITQLQLKIGTTVIKTWDPDELRDQNIIDYQVADANDLTGVYIIPFGDREHLEHQVSITGGQDLELVYEADTDGTDKLVLVSDYFLAPTNA
jgi:hypothetical protein